MYDKVKDRLEHNFDAVAPDLFTNIKNAKADRILSEDELFNLLDEDTHAEKIHAFPLRKAGTLVAAAIFVCIISVFLYSTRVPAGTVTIMADSTIRLSINRSNKIIHAEMDRPGSIDPEDLEGKDLSEGMDIVLDSISSTDSDSENKNVSIKVKSNQKMKSAKKILAEKAEKYSRNKKMVINGNYQSVHNSATAENIDTEYTDLSEADSDDQNDVSTTEKKSSEDTTPGQDVKDSEDTSEVIVSSTSSDLTVTESEPEDSSNDEESLSSLDKDDQEIDEDQADTKDQSETNQKAEAEKQEDTEDQTNMNECQEKADQPEEADTGKKVTTEEDSSQEDQISEETSNK